MFIAVSAFYIAPVFMIVISDFSFWEMAESVATLND
jgi:hypothetical protein